MRTIGKTRGLALAVAAAGLVLAACGSSSHSSTATTASPATTAGSATTASGSATTSGAAAPTGSTINIGVVGSHTGSQASSCGQYYTVAPAWAKWVNATGGINGHPVKVFVEDDQGQPALALSQVEDLIDSDHVVALVVGSDDDASSYDFVRHRQGAGGDQRPGERDRLADQGGHVPHPTGVVAGLADQVAVAVKFGHATKIANAYCSEDPACQQANPVMAAAAKAAGVAFTSIAISSTAPSYTSQCVQLQQEKVDYLVMSFTSTAAVRFVQSCQAQGYNPTWGTSEQFDQSGHVHADEQLHRLRPGLCLPLGGRCPAGGSVPLGDATVRHQRRLEGRHRVLHLGRPVGPAGRPEECGIQPDRGEHQDRPVRPQGLDTGRPAGQPHPLGGGQSWGCDLPALLLRAGAQKRGAVDADGAHSPVPDQLTRPNGGQLTA